jgi:hypothetical protein
VEGDYPKFAQTAKFLQRWAGVPEETIRRQQKTWYEFVHENNIVEDERVPVGHAYAFTGKWGNPLLEELKERRAAEVVGAKYRWPRLSDGTRATEDQYQTVMHEFHQDDIIIDEFSGEVFHSRWGHLWPRDDCPTAEWRQAFDVPLEHDKRSGARYWPLGRV